MVKEEYTKYGNPREYLRSLPMDAMYYLLDYSYGPVKDLNRIREFVKNSEFKSENKNPSFMSELISLLQSKQKKRLEDEEKRVKDMEELDTDNDGNISKKEIKQTIKEKITPEEKAEIKSDIEEAISNEDINAEFREPTGMYNVPAAMAEIFKNNRKVSDERCKEMRRKSIEKMKNGWGETDVMKKKKKEEEQKKK